MVTPLRPPTRGGVRRSHRTTTTIGNLGKNPSPNPNRKARSSFSTPTRTTRSPPPTPSLPSPRRLRSHPPRLPFSSASARLSPARMTNVSLPPRKREKWSHPPRTTLTTRVPRPTALPPPPSRRASAQTSPLWYRPPTASCSTWYVPPSALRYRTHAQQRLPVILADHIIGRAIGPIPGLGTQKVTAAQATLSVASAAHVANSVNISRAHIEALGALATGLLARDQLCERRAERRRIAKAANLPVPPTSLLDEELPLAFAL
ncbi:hypothetical protein OF83DRAFT_776925 [Amylostereum chailletii]|nr:hypothetical protein OF83DRAFT_776925 [Amylostereum chailletii]